VVLQAPDQQLVTATGDFCECYMPGTEMIHGLPGILDHFLGVFVILLETARQCERGETAQKLIKCIRVSNRYEQWMVLQHWTVL
jgi:hypothetical protein